MSVRQLTPSQLARVQYLTRAAGNGEEPAIEALKVIDELREETPVATEKLTDRCDHKFIDSKSCLKCGWTPTSADAPLGKP